MFCSSRGEGQSREDPSAARARGRSHSAFRLELGQSRVGRVQFVALSSLGIDMAADGCREDESVEDEDVYSIDDQMDP